jgi:hypothetical protein
MHIKGHIPFYRAKNNNNHRNWFDIHLVVKEMLYHFVAPVPFTISSFHETAENTHRKPLKNH